MEKKELERLYSKEKMSMKQIGYIYKTSAQTIMRRIHKYNIPVNKQEKAWNSGKTYKDDPRILAKERHPRTKNKIYYNSDFKKIRKEILKYRCNICGGESVVVHHKDNNIMNNNASNLNPLCKSCHTTMHNKERGITRKEIECLWCKKIVEVLHHKICKRKFCSLSCKSFYHYHKTGKSAIYKRNNKTD